MDSLGFTWTHLDSVRLTSTHLDSLGSTCIYLYSPGFIWIHLSQIRFQCNSTLNSFRFTLDPGLTRSHKGKGNHPISQGKREDLPLQKKKGKRLRHSDSTLHPNTARRTHARNETISRFGGASLKADSLPPTSDIHMQWTQGALQTT